jgi:hypothetical protein
MDQLKKLDENHISDEVKKEALGRAEAAIADLKALGLSYTLSHGKPAKGRAGKKKKFVAAEQQEFSFS